MAGFERWHRRRTRFEDELYYLPPHDLLLALLEGNAARVRSYLEENEPKLFWKAPASHAFLWGRTGNPEGNPVWYDLIETRFPGTPPVAAAMKQRLLREGARWADKARMLG